MATIKDVAKAADVSIATVSDSLCTNEHLSTEERQTSFNEMITLALESAIRL